MYGFGELTTGLAIFAEVTVEDVAEVLTTVVLGGRALRRTTTGFREAKGLVDLIVRAKSFFCTGGTGCGVVKSIMGAQSGLVVESAVDGDFWADPSRIRVIVDIAVESNLAYVTVVCVARACVAGGIPLIASHVEDVVVASDMVVVWVLLGVLTAEVALEDVNTEMDSVDEVTGLDEEEDSPCSGSNRATSL